MKTVTLDEAVQKYGPVDAQAGHWPREQEFMRVLALPPELFFPNWMCSVSGRPVKFLYVNRDMAPALLVALKNVKDRGFEKELRFFDGLFCVRFVRGHRPLTPSTHAYGLAIDLNAKANPLGGPIAFSMGFVKCFTDAGFTWGGSFHRVDGMHFQWAGW